jgi:hypothetical protein
VKRGDIARFGYLRRYKSRVGDCRVPQRYKEDGYNLGTWVANQRKANLSAERRQRLDELGFIWNTLEADWEEGFSYLKRYKQRFGDCDAPKRYKQDGYNLGTWVARQRSVGIKISSERRRRLDELGFVWDLSEAAEADWEEGFRYLKRYRDRVGNCRVPSRYREDGLILVSGSKANVSIEVVSRINVAAALMNSDLFGISLKLIGKKGLAI